MSANLTTATLLPIHSQAIGGKTAQTVNGRDLHAGLNLRKDYTDWVKAQIKRVRLVEGRDYLLTQEGEQLASGTKYSSRPTSARANGPAAREKPPAAVLQSPSTVPSKAPSTGLAARNQHRRSKPRAAHATAAFFMSSCCVRHARCIQIAAARPARPASGLAVRVGHPRGCAGSLFRYANLHGLPPLIGVGGGRFTTCQQGAIMADTTATAVRSNAPILSLAGRRAAPITSSTFTDTTDRDTIALHVQAENALSMALGLLRNPQGTAADLERATARACRAATLLKRACAAQAQGGAA